MHLSLLWTWRPACRVSRHRRVIDRAISLTRIAPLAVLLVIACAGEEHAGPVLVGETQTLGNLNVTVHSVRESAREGQIVPSNPGDRWVIFDVTAANRGKAPDSVKQVRLRDDDGVSYAIRPGGGLSDTIAPGNKIRGTLTFAVPQTTELGRLRLLFLDGDQQIQIAWEME